MTLRFPVKTQEPVRVETAKNVRRTLWRNYQNVNGDLDDEFVVPSGHAWRITNILFQSVYGAVAQNQRVEFEIDTWAPDGAGNIAFFALFAPHAANTNVFTQFYPGAYGDTAGIIAVGGTRSLTQYGMPDLVLRQQERLELRIRNYTATDDLIMWLSYEDMDI